MNIDPPTSHKCSFSVNWVLTLGQRGCSRSCMGSYWSDLGPRLGREQNQVYREGNGIHMDMGVYSIWTEQGYLERQAKTGALWFILVSKSRTFKIRGIPQTISVLLDLLQSGTESGNCGWALGQSFLGQSQTPPGGRLTNTVAGSREQGHWLCASGRVLRTTGMIRRRWGVRRQHDCKAADLKVWNLSLTSGILTESGHSGVSQCCGGEVETGGSPGLTSQAALPTWQAPGSL